MDGYIINAKDYAIKQSVVRTLYIKGLIICDDSELEIMRIPTWAKDEFEKIASVYLKESDYSACANNEKCMNMSEVLKSNAYHYPALYKAIVEGEREFFTPKIPQ